jgi:hypothetical protein
MPDRPQISRKREKLATADQHITSAESLVARQLSLLAQLERGRDSEVRFIVQHPHLRTSESMDTWQLIESNLCGLVQKSAIELAARMIPPH